MRHKGITFFVLAGVVLATVSGCSPDGGRREAASRRWQRTMGQVRLDAAQESMDQGDLVYAEQILKESDQETSLDSQHAEQAQRMLAEIRTVHHRFAKARQTDQELEGQIY